MILVSDTSVVLLPLLMQFCMYVWVCKNLGQLKSWNIQNTGSCQTCKTDKMIWFSFNFLFRSSFRRIVFIQSNHPDCVWLMLRVDQIHPQKMLVGQKLKILLYSQNILLDFIKLQGIHHQVILCQIKKSSQLLSIPCQNITKSSCSSRKWISNTEMAE